MSTAFNAPAATSPPPARRLASWHAIRIIHPFPTLLNVAATAGLAFTAADGSPEGSVLWRMLLVMFFAQCAIGVANDLFDRELDAATKPHKPLVAGTISTPAARALAIAFVASSLSIAVTLGPASLGLAALGMGCGLAYDARLKRTLLSPLPFLVAIPTLPLWVYVTLDAWEPVLWWLLPLGGLIGLAIHLANTLPDIESDAEAGIRGFAHALGVRDSMFVSWASFAAALALALVLGFFLDAKAGVYAATLVIGGLCLVATIAAFAVRRRPALQFNFGAVSIGAAVTAAGWLVAVT
jgi:4-hydroxybenzoate polyprenyltransferase